MNDEETITVTREFTVDAGYAGRAACGLLKRLVMPRPSTWLGLALALVAVVLAVLGVDFMWWLGLALVLMTVVLPVVLYFPLRRQFARRFPPGTVLGMGFGDTRFRSDGPDFSTTVAYTHYRRAERTGEFVALLQGRANWSYFPGSLFTDEDVERFPS